MASPEGQRSVKMALRDEHSTASASASPSAEASAATLQEGPAAPARSESPSRFSHLKEKLRMIGSKSKKLNFNSMTALVEEARANRSTVNQNMSIAGSELATLLAIPAEQRQAITWREIVEYGRKVELPLPDPMAVKQRLCAWHRCMTKMTLLEVADGDAVIKEGEAGGQLLWLLKGAAQGADGHDVQMLELIGKEALQGHAYTSTIKATGQAFFATLSCADLAAALEEAVQLSLSSSAISNLKPLLLMPRQDRTRIHLEDIATKLSTYEPYRGLDHEFRREVSSITEYISVPAHSTLFTEGDKVCFCFVILSGSVEMRQRDNATGATTSTCTLSIGEHFGSLSTLIGNDKRRSTSAVALEDCEFAAISRVTYNRLQKKQLQDGIEARMELIKGMSVLVTATETVHTRVAFNSRTEAFSPGQTILNPACYPSRMFIIMEGECKLVWATDDPSMAPEEPMTVSQHHSLHHSNSHQPPTATGMASGTAAAHAKGQVSPRGARKSGTGEGASTSGQDGSLMPRRSAAPGGHGAAAGGSGAAAGQSDAGGHGAGRDHMLRGNSSLRSSGHHHSLPNLQHSPSSLSRNSSLHHEPSQDIPAKETASMLCGCGCALSGHIVAPRYRHSIEVARLGRGDVINGAILSGMAPALTAVAATPVRVMSIEGDSVESVFGTAAFKQLKDIVARQFQLNKQRLQQIATVRQNTSSAMLNSLQYKQMSEDPTSQALFLEHYVSQGPSDMRSATEPPVGARSRKVAGSVTLPALPQGSLPVALPSVTPTRNRSASALAGVGSPNSLRGTPTKLGLGSSAATSASAVANLLASVSPDRDVAGPVSFEDAFAIRTKTSSVPPGATGPSGISPSRRGNSVQGTLPVLPAPVSAVLPPWRSISVSGQPSQGTSSSASKQTPSGSMVPAGSTYSYSTSSSPAPELPHGMWAGNVHACLGDMFEMLADQAAVEAATSSAALGQSAPSTAPILSSPAMLAKAKVQHATSPGAARACADRGRLVMSVDSALGAVVVPQRQGRLGPVSTSTQGPSEDELAQSVAVLPGRMTTYESILRPLEPKKDKRVEMLHDLALATSWGLNKGPQGEREQAQLKFLQAVKQKRDRARQREAARKLQEAQANLGWGTVEKVRHNSDALSAHDIMASGLVSRSDSRSSLGFGQGSGKLTTSGSTGGSFRVRSVKAWHRPDEEINLPLDRDALAPSLSTDKGHGLSQPQLQDIKYILGRWGDRWASDREVAKRSQQQAMADEAAARDLRNQASSMGSRAQEEEELWDLDLYGAPTFGPGL